MREFNQEIKLGTILLATMNNRVALIVNKETFPHEYIISCDEVAWEEVEPYVYKVFVKSNGTTYEIIANNIGNGNAEVVQIQQTVEEDIAGTKSKYIGDVESGRFSLEVYECSCGFHIGLDATYLEQVSAITMSCPACAETIQTLDEEE